MSEKKTTTKNKGGRPPKFKTAAELEKAFKDYKKECEEKEKPFLIIGFANFIESDRQILDEYADKKEFSLTVKKIKQAAEQSLIEGGLTGKYNPTMSIFLAKNNHGYTDKSQQEVTVKEVPAFKDRFGNK